MRVATDGAEMGDLLFFDGGASDVTNSTSNPSSGSRCYSISITGQGIKNIASVSEFYLRTRIRPEAVPNSTVRVIEWRNSSTVLGGVAITATMLPAIHVGTTNVVTGDVSFVQNQYTLVEAHVLISDSSGSVQVTMDGILAAEYSGDTKPGTSSTVDNIRWTGNTLLSSQRIDDIAINDTTGVNDNSWCGDGHILMMTPDADGDVIQLSRGGTDTGANWNQVDEIPPDSDTTYVYSTGSGLYDLYNLTSGSVHVGALDTISRVYIESRIRETAAEGDIIRLGVKSSGSESWSSDIPVTTSYARYERSDMIVNPITGVAWTIADLDNLQVGFKVV